MAGWRQAFARGALRLAGRLALLGSATTSGQFLAVLPRKAPPGPSRSAELTTKPVAALMFRWTGVDIGQCPACHAGRLRVIAVFQPGQLPAPALDTS